MTTLPLAHSTGAVLVSQKIFGKIPPDLAKILVGESENAMADLTSELRAQSGEAVKLIEKSGLSIIPMPAQADLDAFYKVHDLVAKKLTGEIYPKDLLERVYEILNRHP